jgi:hypothetical protein
MNTMQDVMSALRTFWPPLMGHVSPGDWIVLAVIALILGGFRPGPRKRPPTHPVPATGAVETRGARRSDR